MKVGAFGSRNRPLSLAEEGFLSMILRAVKPEAFVHGACRGVDTSAAEVAERDGFELEPYPADWEKHGKKAGPIRNRRMAKRAELWIAFMDQCGPGTRDMVRAVQQRGGILIRFEDYRQGNPDND